LRGPGGRDPRRARADRLRVACTKDSNRTLGVNERELCRGSEKNELDTLLREDDFSGLLLCSAI
jgi:hypothetical protein